MKIIVISTGAITPEQNFSLISPSTLVIERITREEKGDILGGDKRRIMSWQDAPCLPDRDISNPSR